MVSNFAVADVNPRYIAKKAAMTPSKMVFIFEESMGEGVGVKAVNLKC
jgi:hypothetical protein